MPGVGTPGLVAHSRQAPAERQYSGLSLEVLLSSRWDFGLRRDVFRGLAPTAEGCRRSAAIRVRYPLLRICHEIDPAFRSAGRQLSALRNTE